MFLVFFASLVFVGTEFYACDKNGVDQNQCLKDLYHNSKPVDYSKMND